MRKLLVDSRERTGQERRKRRSMSGGKRNKRLSWRTARRKYGRRKKIVTENRKMKIGVQDEAWMG